MSEHAGESLPSTEHPMKNRTAEPNVPPIRQRTGIAPLTVNVPDRGRQRPTGPSTSEDDNLVESCAGCSSAAAADPWRPWAVGSTLGARICGTPVHDAERQRCATTGRRPGAPHLAAWRGCGAVGRMVGMPTNLSIQTILGDVVGSTGHRYAVTDSAGNTTDTVKIITNPAGRLPRRIPHRQQGESGHQHDLLSWVFRRTLDTQATQPTICALPLSLPPGQTTRGVTGPGPGVRRSAGTICLGSDGLDRPRPHRDSGAGALVQRRPRPRNNSGQFVPRHRRSIAAVILVGGLIALLGGTEGWTHAPGRARGVGDGGRSR